MSERTIARKGGEETLPPEGENSDDFWEEHLYLLDVSPSGKPTLAETQAEKERLKNEQRIEDSLYLLDRRIDPRSRHDETGSANRT